MKHLTEVLTAADPVETWIADFVKSDNPRFDGKTKKERIKMALGAYYASSQKNESASDRRALKIVSLALNSTDEATMKFFVESNENISEKSILTIRDTWDEFCANLGESTITVGTVSEIECVVPLGGCELGDVYEGVWVETSKPDQLRLEVNIPHLSRQPNIFFDKNTKQTTTNKNFELL